MSWDKVREKSLTNFPDKQNVLVLEELVEFVTNQNQSRLTSRKTNLKNTFPTPFPSAEQMHKEFWSIQFFYLGSLFSFRVDL